MRKLLVLPLLLALGACSSLSQVLPPIVSAVLPSIENPVTPTMLAATEQSAIVIVAGLNVYKKACVAQTIPPSCRAVVGSIQLRTRKLRPLILDLRMYVRGNDQVNALVAYRSATALISDVRDIANANNIKVQ